jgi:hypothetical protein
MQFRVLGGDANWTLEICMNATLETEKIELFYVFERLI